MCANVKAAVLKVWYGAGDTLAWLELAKNRARIYTAAKLILPGLAAYGVVTGPEEAKILSVAAALVGTPALHLASKNVPKP